MFEVADATLSTVGIEGRIKLTLRTHLRREAITRCREINMTRVIRISPPFGKATGRRVSGNGVGGGFYTVFLHSLSECHAVHTGRRTIDKTTLIQFVEDAEDTTSTSALLHTVLLRVGREFAEAGHLAAQGIDIFHREVGTSLLGHSQQVEHGIRRTAHRDIERHRIHEGLTGGNATRQHALVAVLIVGEGILHHLTGSSLEEFDAVGMCGKDGAVARQ